MKKPMSIILPLGAMFLGEVCIALVVLTLYRLESHGDVIAFLSSRPGLLCAAGVLGFVVSVGVILYQFQKHRLAEGKQFIKIGMMNLVVVILTVVPAELALRIFSIHSPGGTLLGRTLLYPRSWSTLAGEYSRVLDEASKKPTYLVYDNELGWTVGSSRRSQDGLYFTSVEGLRSRQVGEVLAGRSASYRIALLGDSFMFGEEGPFEGSIGHQLEIALGSEFQVLNFGVSGYGVDQMYLRYEKDARRWNPDVVILGFIGDDVTRSMTVYPFIGRPHWLMPWSKPRFVLQGKDLSLLNVPTAPPERIFSVNSVQELPLIHHDHYYCDCDWERSYWNLFYQSYVFRSIISLYPRHEIPRDEISSETRRAIHREIFRSFMDKVKSAGSIPLISLFPSYVDYVNPNTRLRREEAFIMTEAGIEYVDFTSCLERINPHDRFVRPDGGHYTRTGNEAIAQCLSKNVLQALSSRRPGS
jgi:hypothetical protein